MWGGGSTSTHNDIARVVLAAEAGLRRFASDPVAAFRFKSDAQRRFAKSLSEFREVYLRSGNQAGKAQPVDEPVLTPGGWRTIGSLRVGDAIFSGDGSVTTVDGVYPQGVLPVFRASFSDGSSARCSADHLWVVRGRRQRFGGSGGPMVMALGDIVDRWGARPSPQQAVSIPTTGAVQYADVEHAVSPYIMGALLGDGCFQKHSVSLSSADQQVIDRVESESPAGVLVRRTTESGVDYRLTTGVVGGSVATRPRNTVLEEIRALGLGGLHAHEKFIPDAYLRCGVDQRVALLQGLMDSDGWVDRKGSAYFSTTSPRLRDGVMELVRSLGGRASFGATKRSWYSHGGERKRGLPSWSVLVRLDAYRMFHLDRKASRVRASFRSQDRVLRSVEACGQEQCVCISVSSPLKTYLTRDLIVTHNTTVGAYCGVALARGKSELDGVTLPLLGAPNVGLVLAKGRAMAKESVIKAYRTAVGKWPHHLEKNGNAIEAIWVKPDRSQSDDWQDWSCIRFFVEDGQSLAGMRLDWAHADEPPKEEAWRELRMRGKANRHFVRFITATPLDKREWKWLRDDFKGCESGRDGKIELRMSVFDNKALGKEHLAAIEKDSSGPLQQAKLYGDYIDLTGTNPFDAAGLKRWADRAVDPIRIERWATSTGAIIEIEIYAEVVPGESYLDVNDPSAGIQDEQGEHDPCEMVVVSRGVKGRPSVVARYNGYIPAYELGRLARHFAERYNGALLVWERNSGYGEAFYLAAKGYANLYSEYHEDSLHMPLSERMGWLTTATTRGTIIGALQKAVLEDGLYVPSKAAVSSLEDVILDRRGRIEAGAGSHDEDMIVLGLACHLLETYPLIKPDEKPGSQILLEALGRHRTYVREPDPFGW